METTRTAFVRVEGCDHGIGKLLHIRAELRRAGNKTFTAETLATYLKKSDALHALAERLKPVNFPKEVLDFFKAAQHRAPLEKFTEIVRDWLAARNHLNNIRLYIMEP